MSVIAIEDRIFIFKEISELEIFERWQRALNKLYSDRDFRVFSKTVGEIKGSIVKEAQKLMR